MAKAACSLRPTLQNYFKLFLCLEGRHRVVKLPASSPESSHLSLQPHPFSHYGSDLNHFCTTGLPFNLTYDTLFTLLSLSSSLFYFPDWTGSLLENYNVLLIFLSPKKPGLTHDGCTVDVRVGSMLFVMGNFTSW